MPTRICKICNKNFNTKFSRKIYCSKHCAQIGQNKAKTNWRLSDLGKQKRKEWWQSDSGKQSRFKYKKSNKGKLNDRVYSSNRRSKIEKQSPLWNDSKKTKKIFEYALKIETYINRNNTGKRAKVHVDHIIPLKGKTFEGGYPVRGLNVWYNLMPTLDSNNTSKGNICPPEKQIEGITTPHLSLDKLPHPKIWMKFIHAMYNNAVKSAKDKNFKKQMLSDYLELDPRNLK